MKPPKGGKKVRKKVSRNAELFTLIPNPSQDAPPGDNEKAVRATVEELEQAGLLVGRHRASATLLISLARRLDEEITAPKLTVAASNCAKLLQDGLAALPEMRAQTADAYDTLQGIIQAMTREAIQEGSASDDIPTY